MAAGLGICNFLHPIRRNALAGKLLLDSPMNCRLILLVGLAMSASGIVRADRTLHSFADWNLPVCRACDVALIHRTIGRGHREYAWPAAESRPGLEGTPALPKIPVAAAVQLLAQKGKPTPAEPKQEDQNRGTKQYSPSATTGSPGHIFWIIPAFKVDYGKGFQPLSPKEKFAEWAQAEYDPLGLGAGAVEAATLEHSSADGFCGYGHGWAGYGKCFGSLQLDATNSSFIGDFVLPVLLHQDPRYFRLGQGSFGRRVWYAISRVFVTYNDAGHTVFFTSALAGTGIAAGLSNLYYPAQDVGLGHTMTRVAIDLGNTALYNAAAEFWPDIHRALQQIF
jgi:hypothetical protein